MTVENVNRALLKPLALTVADVAAVLVLTPFVPMTTGPPRRSPASGPDRRGRPRREFGFWDAYGRACMLLLLLFASFFAFSATAPCCCGSPGATSASPAAP
jgi:hypothetical protein